jgi:hypothetical protein
LSACSCSVEVFRQGERGSGHDGAGRSKSEKFQAQRRALHSLFTEEADAYVDWLSSLLKNKNADGSLQIMYTIHGLSFCAR